MNSSKKNDIKIIQHILQNQKRFDLAVKLENCYYESDIVDGLYGGFGEVKLFVHPDNFVYFNEIDEQDKNLLLQLFNGLSLDYDEVVNIKFFIDTTINIANYSETLYIFVDEAGDMDFSKNGSKYYMFSFLIKQRPFRLHDYISNYRYSLLEKNLDPLFKTKLDIEAFHASYDNKYVRSELFEIISTFEKESINVYSYILEKPKVEPLKREDRDVFYMENLKYSIMRLLDKLQIKSNFIIITDRLPLKRNKKQQIKALKEGIKSYISNQNLKIRYDIFHHCSASSVNLQVVDYVSWAIFRKYERSDLEFYDKIQKYILEEEIMTKDRVIKYYEV